MTLKTALFIFAVIVAALTVALASIPEPSYGWRLWMMGWAGWNGAMLRNMWVNMREESKKNWDGSGAPDGL